MRRALKKINIYILVSSIIVIGFFLYFLRDYLSYSINDSQYTFRGLNAISSGTDGRLYAVDSAMKKIVSIEDGSVMNRYINGGDYEESYEYAVKICEDSEQNIYISEIKYLLGGVLERERVIRFSGDKRTILLDADYTRYANPPMGFGEGTELKCIDGTVYFLYKGNAALILYEVVKDSAVAKEVLPCDIDILDASYDKASNAVAVSSRQGDLYVCYLDDREWRLLDRRDEVQLPNSITFNNGIIYSVDEINSLILKNDVSDRNNLGATEVAVDNGMYYMEISPGPDDDTIMLTDSESITLINVVTGEETNISSVDNAFFVKIVFTWLLLIIVIILFLVFLIRILVEIAEYYYRSDDKAGILRICMVAMTAVLVSASISYASITNIDVEIMDNERESMDYTMALMEEYIDPEQVHRLGQTQSSYGTEEYNAMRYPLDRIIDSALDNGLEYYYILLSVSDTGLDFVADYERDYCTAAPYMEFGDDLYTEAVLTGKTTYDFSDISSYGSYISMMKPFKDKSGKVVAMMELGKPYDQIMDKKSDIIKENVFSVVCSSIVVTMLMLEVLFAINFFDRQRKIKFEDIDSTEAIPLRLITFAIYLTDCMQDAFVALLCEKLYNEGGNLGILSELPKGFAIALPLSLQLLFAALASFVGGNMIAKLGTKKVMSFGLIVQMVGMIICALTSNNYVGLLIGKIFIGLGQGIVYVTANTMAAITDDEEKSNKAFADVSAGILSGVSAGAGLGATLFSMGSYPLVYFFGAIVLFFVFILSLTVKDFRKTEKDMEEMAEMAVSGASTGKATPVHVKKRIGIIRFFFNREIFGFLIFILTPFLIAVSFRDYFFPLYAGQNGISELRIGQIFLLCGVATLYVGPIIAKSLLAKIGPKLSIMLSSLAMAVVVALYLIKPGINIVIFAVVLFSFITSFAYSCQYAYFESIPATKQFGEGKAMGIYSVFESLGQTVGPVYFGAILTIGTSIGLGVSALGLVGLTAVFGLWTLKKKNKKNSEENI